MAEPCAAHSGVCVNMENILKQTESNTQDIKTLSDAVIKLTVLVESLKTPPPPPVKTTFWDVNTKKYVFKLGFILCVILICALIGTNIITDLDVSKLIK